MMIIHPGYVGIDISKPYLDVYDGCVGKPERFANTVEQARELARRFKAQGSLVLFEATGRYDLALSAALAAEGLSFARVNPNRAWHFAKAAGQLAKTDALDARMLAAMGQAIPADQFVPASPERQKLADLQLRRDQLVSMRAEEKARLEALGNAFIAKGITEHITRLGEEIAEYEALIADHVDTSPELAKTATLLRSIPGIGPVICSVLIAHMPELGRCSPGEIAALAGLAPFNADSGSSKGKRRIKGGRTRVRKALYMAALVATRYAGNFKTFYKHLRDNGKPVKVAFIATARKILLTANAMIRDNLSYNAA